MQVAIDVAAALVILSANHHCYIPQHDARKTTAFIFLIDFEWIQEYLYYFCDPPVFHVTVNSSNVMMDADFVAKVSHIGTLHTMFYLRGMPIDPSSN